MPEAGTIFSDMSIVRRKEAMMRIKIWISMAAIAVIMLTVLWLVTLDIVALYLLFGGRG